MKKNLFIAVSAIVLLAACNNNDETFTSSNNDQPQLSNEFAISNDEAKGLLNYFINDGATTRSDGKTITVKDYKVRNIEVTTDDNTEIVPLYEYTTVNENGDEGYSIVIGDRRIQKVLVQVDKGSLADTTEIMPLKLYYKSIPNIICSDLERYNKKILNKDNALTRYYEFNIESYGPLLNTKWTQHAPYNNACPSNNCLSGENTLTGCTALAVGRLLAYYHRPSSMNWTSILQSPILDSSSSTSDINAVASLLFYVGNNLLNATYGCDDTTISESSFLTLPSVLNSYSLSNAGIQSFNLSSVINYVRDDRPVFLTMDAQEGGSHDWICDGWKRHNYDVNDYYDYLYMSWGFPYSEGYYYIDPSNVAFYVNGYHYYSNSYFRMIGNIH